VIEPIHSAVDVPAVHGEGVVRPPALDVHQMKQTRAIGVLVEHPHGQQVRPVAAGINRIVSIRRLNHTSALHKDAIHLSKIGQKPHRL